MMVNVDVIQNDMLLHLSTTNTVFCCIFCKTWARLCDFFFFSSGLSEAEAKKLDNFLHFRQSKNKKKSALDMGDWNPAMDYLDALSDDIPKGDTTELNLS